MKFALVQGQRREAEKGLIGICEGCEKTVLPVCGAVRVKHWRHSVNCECDHWWENETEWHRNWKNNFPVETQEIRHKDELTGECHIADIKTKQGYILEFQHSFLNPKERTERNSFYGANLIWIVDGLKRKRDISQFEQILKGTKRIANNLQLYQLSSIIEDCSLLLEWSECKGCVFFDFGAQTPLWCLFPKSRNGNRYIGPLNRQTFIELHNGLLTKNGQSFVELMKVLTDLICMYENTNQGIRNRSSTLNISRYYAQRQSAVPAKLSRRELYYLNRLSRSKVRL